MGQDHESLLQRYTIAVVSGLATMQTIQGGASRLRDAPPPSTATRADTHGNATPPRSSSSSSRGVAFSSC